MQSHIGWSKIRFLANLQMTLTSQLIAITNLPTTTEVQKQTFSHINNNITNHSPKIAFSLVTQQKKKHEKVFLVKTLPFGLTQRKEKCSSRTFFFRFQFKQKINVFTLFCCYCVVGVKKRSTACSGVRRKWFHFLLQGFLSLLFRSSTTSLSFVAFNVIESRWTKHGCLDSRTSQHIRVYFPHLGFTISSVNLRNFLSHFLRSPLKKCKLPSTQKPSPSPRCAIFQRFPEGRWTREGKAATKFPRKSLHGRLRPASVHDLELCGKFASSFGRVFLALAANLCSQGISSPEALLIWWFFVWFFFVLSKAFHTIAKWVARDGGRWW